MVTGTRSVRFATLLLGSALGAAALWMPQAHAVPNAAPDAASAGQGPGGPKDSFLLIDGGAPSGQARLTGCDQAISNLHASLDQVGAQNTVLIAPAASAMRDALLRFGAAGAGTPHAVLFCGYATETGGNVFALGSDFAPHDDPALAAVSIRAFSRVAGGKDGLVLLDLHPMVVDGAPATAAAGALQGAASAWSEDATLGGTKLASTDRQPGDASLIAKAARSGSGTTDGIARAVASQELGPANAPAPPEPAAHTATAAPPAAMSPPPADSAPKTASTEAPAADSQPAKDATGAAIPLAPTQAGGRSPGTDAGAAPSGTGTAVAAAPPTPPRPRVHVDPAVRRVQVALLARGLFSGRVNGINTTDTQRAVRHFQAMLGHPVTGQLTSDETKELTGG